MFAGTVREIWRYPVKSMAGERLDACAVTPTGVLGDRSWALRDDAAGEIRGAKKWPALLQCHATYIDPPADGLAPHVTIRFPGGSTVRSDNAEVSARLSEFLGAPVSLWPVQPASNTSHYRRAQPGASLVALLGRSRPLRSLLQAVAPFTPLMAQLREEFSRDPGEPVPDLSVLPAELFEFTTPPGTYFDAFPIHVLTTASLDAMTRFNPSAAWDVRRFRPNFLVESPDSAKGLAEQNWVGRNVRIGRVEVTCTIAAPRCGMTMHAQTRLPKDPSILRTIVRDAAQLLGVYASIVTAGNVQAGDRVEVLS